MLYKNAAKLLEVCPTDIEYDTKLLDFSKEDNTKLSERIKKIIMKIIEDHKILTQNTDSNS